jgi:hypothetical protein
VADLGLRHGRVPHQGRCGSALRGRDRRVHGQWRVSADLGLLRPGHPQLAQAIATALLTIADLGAYAPLVDAILAAIPTAWYTDDPDYVDSWYTLSTASTGRLNGAAANGWMDVSPYFVTTL